MKKLILFLFCLTFFANGQDYFKRSNQLIKPKSSADTLDIRKNNLMKESTSVIVPLTGKMFGGDFRGTSYGKEIRFNANQNDSVWLSAQSQFDGITFQNGAVVMQFDDGALIDFDSTLKYLRNRHLVGSFSIAPAFIATSGYMTYAQIDSLFYNGNEILAHSYTHNDTSGYTFANFWHETVDARDTLLAHGYSIKSFVSPGGWSGDLYTLMFGYYRNILLSTFAGIVCYVDAPQRFYAAPLNKRTMFSFGYEAAGTTASTLTGDLRKAISSNSILRIKWHPATFGTAGYITWATFGQMLDSIKSFVDNKGLKVLTTAGGMFATKSTDKKNVITDSTFDLSSTGNLSYRPWYPVSSPQIVAGNGDDYSVKVNSSNYVQFYLPVYSGSSYKLSYTYRADSTNGATGPTVQLYNDNNSQKMNFANANVSAGDTSWHSATINFCLPTVWNKTGSPLNMNYLVIRTADTKYARFDNFDLRKQ